MVFGGGSVSGVVGGGDDDVVSEMGGEYVVGFWRLGCVDCMFCGDDVFVFGLLNYD